MLDALEAGLKSLISSLTACTKNRLALSSSAAELSASYTALATCELSDNVKTALKGLSDAERKRAEVAEAQAREEEVLLLAVADQYIRSISSVRAALQSRVKNYQSYQRSESTLKSLRTSHEKIKAKSGRINPDLVTHSLFEITEAERRVISLKKDFEDVSRLLKTSEWAKFEAEKVADFKRAIEQYAKGLVERQKEVVEGWKKYVSLLEGGLGKRNSVTGEGQSAQNQPIAA
jgi:sorting nexin-1/2